MTVRARGRNDDQISCSRLVEIGVADQDVARFAVFSDQMASGTAAKAISYFGLITGAVEHRPQVV